MLAYYVEWHMRQRLKALLFDDEEPQAAQAARASVVAGRRLTLGPRQSPAQTHRSGESVHSFRTLLDDLATIAKNRVVAPLATPSRSTSSLDPPRCSAKPSSCWGFAWNVPSSHLLFFCFIPG